MGGVGSGKSLLARWLAENHRVLRIDADIVGHEVLRQPEVKAEIRSRFGPQVFDAAGEVDRRKMSLLVFGNDPPAQAARQALEAIVHPRISEELSQQISDARNNRQFDAVVLDAAVLLETGWRQFCNHIVFVDAPLAQRQARVGEARGWSADQLRSREASQLSLEEKRREADDVVDNSRDAQHAISQIDAIFNKLVRRPAG